MSRVPDRNRWFDRLLAVLPALLVLATLHPGPRERTNACLWDSDSLRTEANGLPGVAEIITGRFDRFPPEYYEARLGIVNARVSGGEATLADYDDAAVACDRLGRGDEAIAWMDRKRDMLERMERGDSRSDEQTAVLADARYRYLANLGTFHAHRWIRRGASRDDLSDLERARDLIAAAIELNPDAHFGRERYQLLAIEWLLDAPAWEGGLPPTFFGATLPHNPDLVGFPYDQHVLESAGYRDAVEGLSGLIALGGAWESVDCFLTLAAALDDRGDAALAHLARLRAKELIEKGSASLHTGGQLHSHQLESQSLGYAQDRLAIERWFEDVRLEAEAWRTARNDYVKKQLSAGSHPDTDPEFWSAWVEPSSPPSKPNGLFGMVGAERASFIGLIVLGVSLLVVLTALVLLIRFLWRWRARSIAAEKAATPAA